MKNIVLRRVPAQLAMVQMLGVTVDASSVAYELLTALGEKMAAEYEGVPISEVPGVQSTRSLFRSIGIDPTRRRPASEALLNRALKGKGFFQVNSVVDVGNWCSLEFCMPTFVYDSRCIQGDVEARFGGAGEHYLALNKRDMNFENRVVLADESGPFGSPLTDSQRTAVSDATRDILFGIWAAEELDFRVLRALAEKFAVRMQDTCGGHLKALEVLTHSK